MPAAIRSTVTHTYAAEQAVDEPRRRAFTDVPRCTRRAILSFAITMFSHAV
jgi:hypothetical protein